MADLARSSVINYDYALKFKVFRKKGKKFICSQDLLSQDYFQSKCIKLAIIPFKKQNYRKLNSSFRFSLK